MISRLLWLGLSVAGAQALPAAQAQASQPLLALSSGPRAAVRELDPAVRWVVGHDDQVGHRSAQLQSVSAATAGVPLANPGQDEARAHDEAEEGEGEEEPMGLFGQVVQFGIAGAFLLGMVVVLVVLRRS